MAEPISGSTIEENSTNTKFYDFSIDLLEQWEDGFRGTITIKNISKKSIENWAIKMQFSFKITSITDAIIYNQKPTKR